MSNNSLKLALLCGGPSPERGISLNSARSVLDHLESEALEVIPYYFDYEARPFRISTKWLYCNTPSDFDFKLASEGGEPLSEEALITDLKQADICFPVMHGKFGEDGEIQRILESNDIPFIGTSVDGCELAFDKYLANEFIREKGFHAPATLVLENADDKALSEIKALFKEDKIERAIVKPATGGSSIGVFSVDTPEEAFETAGKLLDESFYSRVVVEPFCTGREFTVIIVENDFEQPVALLPVEIETEYSEHQIFDYRKKYLPTRQVTYHCPPTFSDLIVEQIQIKAEQLFSLLGMRDFARFDGWLLPNGKLWFSDFNPVSGMDQNSFLFLQAARVGMTHRDILNHILVTALKRYGLSEKYTPPTRSSGRKRVNVIFGGSTAEKQVSVMSGTNSWLKLTRSDVYDPHPYLLDLKGDVWELPYALCLNHTAEEIGEACTQAKENEARDSALRFKVHEKLTTYPGLISQTDFMPHRMSLEEFIQRSDTVLIGLHGGFGEDGTFQKMLSDAGINYNGPDSEASKLCSDKYEFGKRVEALKVSGLKTAPKRLASTAELAQMSKEQLAEFWSEITAALSAAPLIVKPVSDGCSAGVVLLYGVDDLQKYVELLEKGVPRIPGGVLTEQKGIVELPATFPSGLLFECFIETDDVTVSGNDLIWNERSGWVEITVGVIGPKGEMKALNPSITVAAEHILSVEEKFQGGTGINITPPPVEHVSKESLEKAKRNIEILVNDVGLGGYSRIDAFLECKSGDLIIIEANTLPALTPSTVLFHQALAEENPLFPTGLIEKILSC